MRTIEDDLYNVIHMNLIGITCAIAAFMGIWMGHVAVRRIEFNARSLTFPILGMLFGGLALGTLSALTWNVHLSSALGIIGITLLWDALEFVRQERRVRKGHAPANPNNPRHAIILNEYPSATMLDPLRREPRGLPYSADELKSLSAGDS